MRPGRGVIAIVLFVAVLLVFLGGSQIANFVAELLWYRSLSLDSVFWTYWRASIIVRGLTALIIGGIVFGNLWVITRSLGAIRVRRRYGNIEIAERLPQGYVVGALSLISIFSAWWLSSGFADPLPFLAALSPASFGIADSAFGLDASFYVFRLPVLSRIQTILAIVVFWVALLAFAAYASTGGIRMTDGRPSLTRLARRHLGALLAAFLVLYAFNLWLDRYALVVDGNGFGGVFGYTDMHARLPVKVFLFGFVLLVAGSIAWGTWVGAYRLPIMAGLLLPIVLVGAEGIYPSSIQRFVVDPNQFPRESAFIEQQIAFTRAAFNLTDIERVQLPFDPRADLDREDVSDRLEGVPLWDPRPLLTTFGAQQSLFRRYTFNTVHHDRYRIGDRLEPVAISVRELETNDLEAAAQTWQNLHLNYVSSAGVVVTPLSRMSPSGTPIYYVWDLDPPKFAPEAPPEVRMEDPRIYFSELAREYIIVGEEHPPIGVALDATWKKAIFALNFRSKNILLSTDVDVEDRIVFRRRIAERVQAAAPFLHVPRERSAFPVILEGRVVWMIDTYTMSPSFPLTPYVQFDNRLARYIRNSVKATVDGVTGEVSLYAIDPDDPILRTYSAIFPGLIRPLEEMPEALQLHLRYPVQLMSVQAQVLNAYHLLDPRAFYEQEDVWSIATEHYRGTPTAMEPIYAVYPLPGEERAEFHLSLPFVARGRQNMTALMVTRNDPPHYGEQIVYLLPRDEQIPGPQQIEASIDQNPEISQQLALWRRGGSDVLRGHLVVVPIEGSLVYVEPLFLEAENAAIPQLERVILAHGGSVVMEPSFEAAVAVMTAGERPTTPRPTDEAILATRSAGPDDRGTLERARRILDDAEAHLRAGDWAAFGQALQSLRQVLSPATVGS